MSSSHLVKIGLMGVVGRFDSADFNVYPRDTKVICRTARGLESGIVICPIEEEFANEVGRRQSNGSSNGDSNGQTNGTTSVAPKPDGQILRRVGSEDDLILERLERHRDKAFKACQKLITERELPGVLVDVEHLFDGESVYFYFLGDVDSRLEQVTSELAETYEQKVRFKKFAETLANGCGPDCGTGDSKCSTGGCGSCALSGGCGSKKS